MGYITPKLNLNKIPKVVGNNNLIFAKNIRLNAAGEIHKDYGISPITLSNEILKGNIDYDDIFFKAEKDIDEYIDKQGTNFVSEHYIYYRNEINNLNSNGFYKEIVGIIPDSNSIYIFCNGCYYIEEGGHQLDKEISVILCYDEKENTILPCNCNWKYSGGTIDGCIVTNLIGDVILNIGEHIEEGFSIPFKCINLSKSSYLDDETLYTQAPNIPITNLEFVGNFSFVIPNGVYQFFIRYKIRDDFYTDWFPASKELFAGNSNATNTNFGTLKYVNTHTDADKSFEFNVTHLFKDYCSIYKSFQIGFILSHDDAIYARAWKHFDMNQNSIKFDYRAVDAEEIEVTDLTTTSYQLFNVGNITSFKNKLYISNYTETNFDENLQDYADSININILEKNANSESYDGKTVITSQNGNTKYIIGINLEGDTYKYLYGSNGIIDTLIKTSGNNSSAETLLNNSTATSKEANNAGGLSSYNSAYGFQISTSRTSLLAAQNIVNDNVKHIENYVSGPNFGNNTVTKITVDGVEVNDINSAITKIYNTIRYLSFNAQFYDNTYSIKSSFKVSIYRAYTYKYKKRQLVPIEPSNRAASITPEDSTWIEVENTSSYSQDIYIYFSADKNLIETNNTNELLNFTTLIPHQKYKFYVHYVKQTGEITNGYYCTNATNDGGEITINHKDIADSILYPEFTNIIIPNGYVACFFSIFHSGVYASTIFNINRAYNGTSNVIIEGTCIEANSRLIPIGSVVNCKAKIQPEGYGIDEYGLNDVVGTFHYSGDSSVIRYFGADGVITFPLSSDVVNNKLAYAITDYDSQQTVDVSLIKCTPYIIDSAYSNPQNLNLLGYICQVSPLSRERATGYYSDGSTVYKKRDEFNVTDDHQGYQIGFTELGVYSDSTYKAQDFTIINTNIVNIYSNYNLNYLALSEEPKTTNKTYYTVPASSNVTTANGVSVIWRLLTSLTLCEVYELPSMYKEYTRKIYSPYKNDSINIFNNTIRSSELVGDEVSVSIFKFNADDYYNVPTNRGKIVNLVAIGDNILVHTRDSVFKFTGSNSLSASTGEIVATETEPFNTGISEMFGSDFGFAGLQNKEDSIITEYGYIFFDRDSNVIYMISDQNKVEKLSDGIETLFTYDKIRSIHFANDFYNNRFFVCIHFNEGKRVTLSFNLMSNVKSFVSLHDFTFEYAFNTKVNCYFLDFDKTNICKIDRTRYGIYEKLIAYTDRIYPNINNDIIESRINGYDEEYNIDNTVRVSTAIIDVIINDNYEIVKTLNSIQWCSGFIDTNFSILSDSDIKSLLVAEPVLSNIPCNNIRIYTDTCATPLIDCENISNNYSINDINSYEKPRYNQGKWSLNYFRNILNSEDIFNYKQKTEQYRINDTYDSDNNSLIEGKYFVVRFIFKGEQDFKLETVSLNVTNKI